MKRMYYIGYMLCLLLAGCVVGEKADGLLEQRLIVPFWFIWEGIMI